VVENLLKLSGGCIALSGRQVRLSAHISRIKARDIGDEINLAKLDRRNLQGIQRSSWIFVLERNRRLNRGKPERLHLGVQWNAVRQILCQRPGTSGVASHGECQRGFDLDNLTRGSQLQSRFRRPPGLRRIAVSRLPQGSN